MFKPLLAATADIDAIKYPVLATPKIDGIRSLSFPGGPVSRTLKPIPNDHIRSALAAAGVEGTDGEILTYTNGVRDDFNTVQSKVTRRDGEPEFKLIGFDRFDAPDLVYPGRILRLRMDSPLLEPLLPVEINNRDELDAYEAECVDKLGWEGVMLRRPDGRYKFGRSTTKEGILLKLKRFTDAEAVITGFTEQMENTNEAKTNVFGRTERSSCKAGMLGKDTLGALQCRWNGIDFELGTGFSQVQRDDLWSQRSSLPGQKVTFKFQGVGTHGAPRFPVFIGIRRDL